MSNAIQRREIQQPSTDARVGERSADSGSFKQIPIKLIPIKRSANDKQVAATTGTGWIDPTRATRVQKLKWAGARLLFMGYVGFALFSLVGGFISAPLMTKLFFNDWRFWRHWRRGWRLLPHGWMIFWMVLRKQGQFMFSVPLASPPQSIPDRDRVRLSPHWNHGSSCGDCQRCCQVQELHCPVLDHSSGFCTGYNSFYWRYFNCGRYPSRQLEIDYYGCDKWLMQDESLRALNPVFESNL
jgi:hypothetical protein